MITFCNFLSLKTYSLRTFKIHANVVKVRKNGLLHVSNSAILSVENCTICYEWVTKRTFEAPEINVK